MVLRGIQTEGGRRKRMDATEEDGGRGRRRDADRGRQRKDGGRWMDAEKKDADKKKPCPPSIPRPSCLVRPQRTKKKSLTLVFFFVPFALAWKKYENLLTMICVKRLWKAVVTWLARVRERAESITIRSDASCGPCWQPE